MAIPIVLVKICIADARWELRWRMYYRCRPNRRTMNCWRVLAINNFSNQPLSEFANELTSCWLGGTLFPERKNLTEPNAGSVVTRTR
jgi:hypothetical protein